MTTENKQRYNERLARARSAKMSTIIAPPERNNGCILKDIPNQVSETDIFKDVPNAIHTSVTTFGDLESGGVIVNNNITEKDIHVQFQDTYDDKNLRVVDRRGPCNRFERGICSLGKRFGIKVVFEYQ